MRVIVFFLVWALCAATPAFAQAKLALYRVDDVAVSVKAASAAQAKEEALAQARRMAFDTLIFRLGANDTAKNISAETLDSLVQSFDVHKENAGPGRYAGTLTFQFKPSAVKAFLDSKGVEYGENASRPVVVLPILTSGGRAILWEEATFWRDVWRSVADMSGRAPLIVPQGDLADIATISAREALAGEEESLRAVMSKYGAIGVLVAVLKSEQDTQSQFWNAGEITLYRYGEGGGVLDPIAYDFAGLEDARVRDVLKEEAKKMAAEAVFSWNGGVGATTASASPEEKPVVVITCAVPVPTIAAWTRIKARVAEAPSVLRVNVASMTRGIVQADITFRGSVDTLRTELEFQDLDLIDGGAGLWQIKNR